MVAPNDSAGPGFGGPLFITGMWRSGSSLLYALLNKHPRVGLMYEADLMLMCEAFWALGRAGWAQRWESWNQAVSRHDFDVAQLQGMGQNFRAAFASVHKEFAARKGADIWGDKSPDLYDRMVPLAENFPGARFIVVWRRPEAIISSMQAAAEKGARFFQKRGMALRGLIGNSILRLQCDGLLARNVPVCEINYEDLVAETDRVMLKVCQFLGIPFETQIVSLEGANRKSLHVGEHHSLLNGDKIVSAPRSQILTEKTQQKVQRYVNFWSRSRRENRLQPASPDAPLKIAGPVERLADHSLYRAFRFQDGFKRFAFCVAPLKLVTRHRQRKGHGG